ncbi:MAG: hypothetical protein AB1540_02075 [Bdellovibrionota bacterium]
MNDYQGRLKTSLIPAYVGTFGGLLVLGGGIIYSDNVPSNVGRRDTRYAFMLSGLFLVLAGYGYGQYALKEKEKALEKAVKIYNDSVPAPERVRVTVTPTGDGGGEIKTEVPF